MRFRLQIDGVEQEVVVEADGRLTVGGEAFQTKVSALSDDRRSVQVGDKTYDIRVVDGDARAGSLVVELAGERIALSVAEVSANRVSRGRGGAGTVPGVVAAPASRGVPGGDIPASGARSADSAAQSSKEVKDGIWAPMPGKIVDILVQAGDMVEEGDAALILEAMKMENELKVPKKATIASVVVNKGDHVERGQLLLAFV